MVVVTVILIIWLMIPVIVFVVKKMDYGNKVIRWYDSRHSETNKMLDMLLNACLDSGVKSVSFGDSEYKGTCEFGNGWVYTFWNTNIPYAWLSEGCFEVNGKQEYKYNGSMPSKKTMNRFYNALCKYYKVKVLSLQ